MTTATRTPALVLLCGASFSGKSSLSQILADGLGAQIVSLDAINGERGLWGGQGIPVSEWAQTNAEAHQRVDKQSPLTVDSAGYEDEVVLSTVRAALSR